MPTRLFDPARCIDPECSEPPVEGGLYCGACLECMAHAAAEAVGHVPAFAPKVSWFREEYGEEELTLAQAAWLHDRTLAICRGRSIAAKAFAPGELKVWASAVRSPWPAALAGVVVGVLFGALVMVVAGVAR